MECLKAKYETGDSFTSCFDFKSCSLNILNLQELFSTQFTWKISLENRAFWIPWQCLLGYVPYFTSSPFQNYLCLSPPSPGELALQSGGFLWSTSSRVVHLFSSACCWLPFPCCCWFLYSPLPSHFQYFFLHPPKKWSPTGNSITHPENRVTYK